MKLPFINDGIFKPHKSLVERRESSYIYIYIYIYNQRSHVGEYEVLPCGALFDKEFIYINSLLKCYITNKD